MAYKVIILYQLYMPSYFLGTFTEYPCLDGHLYLFCWECCMFMQMLTGRTDNK